MKSYGSWAVRYQTWTECFEGGIRNTGEPKVTWVCAWCQCSVTVWHFGLIKNKEFNIVYSCQLTDQAKIFYFYFFQLWLGWQMSSSPPVRWPEKYGNVTLTRKVWKRHSALDYLLIGWKESQFCAGLFPKQSSHQCKPAGALLPCLRALKRRQRMWNLKIFISTFSSEIFNLEGFNQDVS